MWDILAGQAWKNAESKGLLRGKTLSDHVDGIISEIDEALEAYNCQNRAYYNSPKTEDYFDVCIKDSLEDELADIFIRSMTMCEEFGVLKSYSIYFSTPCFMGNVVADLGYLKSILKSDMFDDFYKAICSVSIVVDMCDELSIPLAWHIQEKMKYNKSRPFLHGKVDIS